MRSVSGGSSGGSTARTLAGLATAFVVARASAFSSSPSQPAFPLIDITSAVSDAFLVTDQSPLPSPSPLPLPAVVSRQHSAVQLKKGASPGLCESREYLEESTYESFGNVTTQTRTISVGSLNAAAAPPTSSFTVTTRTETATASSDNP